MDWHTDVENETMWNRITDVNARRTNMFPARARPSRVPECISFTKPGNLEGRMNLPDVCTENLLRGAYLLNTRDTVDFDCRIDCQPLTIPKRPIRLSPISAAIYGASVTTHSGKVPPATVPMAAWHENTKEYDKTGDIRYLWNQITRTVV